MNLPRKIYRFHLTKPTNLQSDHTSNPEYIMSEEQGPSQEKGAFNESADQGPDDSFRELVISDPGAKETAIDIEVIDDVGSLKDGAEDCLQYSVFAAFCCCFLCGIPAVRYSRQVRQAKQRGDMVTARRASQYSKRMTAAAIVCGMVIWYTVMFYVIFSNFKFK